ncbi:MAG: hypothetical protein ACYS8Y_10475, partial [Planctomycetota bacterium]
RLLSICYKKQYKQDIAGIDLKKSVGCACACWQPSGAGNSCFKNKRLMTYVYSIKNKKLL